jgi:hypothetical protein
MHLSTYLDELGRGSATTLGAALGWPPSKVSKLRSGAYWPTRDEWAQIVVVTRGAVTPNDHIPRAMENGNAGRKACANCGA